MVPVLVAVGVVHFQNPEYLASTHQWDLRELSLTIICLVQIGKQLVPEVSVCKFLSIIDPAYVHAYSFCLI